MLPSSKILTMRYLPFSFASAILLMVAITSCQGPQNKTTENEKTPSLSSIAFQYDLDTSKFDGYIVYDSAIDGPRPAVLVVPEWWGLNEYAQRRSRELAELGYIAMAVDLYGDGHRGTDLQTAGALAGACYQNPQMTKRRFDAAFAQLKKYAQCDSTRVAAIGYCFGGAMVLNMARMGENLRGVVSFHGNLAGVPLDKSILRANILVLHGEADQFVTQKEVDAFKHQMDSAGVNYTFKSYANATHAFTNPDATENGKKFGIPIAYNAAADTASFQEMKTFLKKVLQ